MTALIIVKRIIYFSGPNTYLLTCLWRRNGKGGKCPVTKCTTVMSTVNSDDFGSSVAFASQLVFVLHDCLNPIGGALKCQR